MAEQRIKEILQLQDLSQDNALIDISKIYESLRYNDYSVENGLGEIVDNSVEAGASEIRVYFVKKTRRVGKKEVEEVDKIIVLDNGSGMNPEVLSKCLVLGYSMREKKNGKLGIGKFGVGMTLGGISIARHVEVYSKSTVNGEFYRTYIDLDEIKTQDQRTVPEPIKKSIPSQYQEFYRENTGTIVILSNCDRMDGSGKKTDSGEMNGLIATYLGRTYRKFIEGGLKIYLDDKPVYLHDPLYISGPTQFDTKEKQDPKAILYSDATIDLPIPGGNGETEQVSIRLSLLPKEWRLNIGDGGNAEARKRKIDQNEGVSILRANREVLYDKVPYLIGIKKGQFSYQENDRWWGCEISFPPELDEYFQVRYIKRGAEPIGALKDRLKAKLTEPVTALRKTIKADRNQKVAEDNKDKHIFDNVEQIMSDSSSVLPKGQAGKRLSKEQEQNKINEILDQAVAPNDSRDTKRDELLSKMYSIVPVKYPQHFLFETEVLLDDKIVIKLNVNHPFYQKIINPLCGDIAGADHTENYNEKTRIKDAIMLLLLSFAKAEANFPDTTTNKELLDNLVIQWGTILGTVVNKMNLGKEDSDVIMY
ncbi:MAG: ATP-binding protein [Clostridiales bacterium]|nr:ATP-binding protein [Clostridiales bacterium]